MLYTSYAVVAQCSSSILAPGWPTLFDFWVIEKRVKFEAIIVLNIEFCSGGIPGSCSVDDNFVV